MGTLVTFDRNSLPSLFDQFSHPMICRKFSVMLCRIFPVDYRFDSTTERSRKTGGIFDTIRNVILARYPELVRAVLAIDPSGESAFESALIHYVDSLLDVTLDGWDQLHLVCETEKSLRAFGVVHLLPSDILPLEVELTREGNSTRYWLRLGIGDKHWYSLTKSKRWKAAYLYASGDRDEEWNWSAPISGYLADP